MLAVLAGAPAFLDAGESAGLGEFLLLLGSLGGEEETGRGIGLRVADRRLRIRQRDRGAVERPGLLVDTQAAGHATSSETRDTVATKREPAGASRASSMARAHSLRVDVVAPVHR